MFKRNVTYKFVALVVALVIWAYANQGRNPTATREIKVPLDVRQVDASYVVTSAPELVRVVVEGPRSYVDSIALEPEVSVAYVNLHGKSAGRHISPVIVRLPEGLMGTVTAHSLPREASILLEKKAEKILTVEPQFIGSPPVGYRYGKPQVSPGRVVISGTSERVKQVEQLVVTVDTEAPTEEGIKGDFRVTALDRNGRQCQNVELSPEKVHLRLDLLEAPASRAVFVSVDTVGQPPFPHRIVGIDVYPQTITISGRPESLVNINSLKTEPIQLANKTKTFTERVEIIPRAGLTLSDGKDVRVTVRIDSPSEPPVQSEPPAPRE